MLNFMALNAAVVALQQGQVIAYPTEAVYGLGCDPFNEAAFNHLLDLKQRPIEKGVILIAANVAQISDLAVIFNQAWSNLVLKSWENADCPITWILPATDKVPVWITGGRKTVAVRVTHHPQVKALCCALNSPLVSTSANLSGEPPIKSATDCFLHFPEVSILEGSLSGLSEPSQIWDAQTQQRVR